MHVVYFEDGQAVLRETGGLADDGVRVHVRSTGICGSDLHMLQLKFPTGCIAGHEVAGVLDDGTPVAIEPVVPCGRCEYCERGAYNLCPQVAVLGISRNGGMADEVIVPERCLVHLPSNVKVEDACLIEPLGVVVHGMRNAGVLPGQRIAVIGGGTIGLCTVAVAGASHAEIDLAARYEHQIAAGQRLGAGEIEGLYDLVAECAGTDKAMKRALDLCRPGGTILILGTYWGGISFPQIAAMMKEITIVNCYMYAEREGVRDFDIAAGLLARRPEIAATLITHRFPLTDARHAFSAAQDRKAGAVKVVMTPDTH